MTLAISVGHLMNSWILSEKQIFFGAGLVARAEVTCLSHRPFPLTKRMSHAIIGIGMRIDH
jgi:hypothetical protein